MNTKILLVDDEKDIVEFLQYNLKKEGFDVVTAYNGKEAGYNDARTRRIRGVQPDQGNAGF